MQCCKRSFCVWRAGDIEEREEELKSSINELTVAFLLPELYLAAIINITHVLLSSLVCLSKVMLLYYSLRDKMYTYWSQ